MSDDAKGDNDPVTGRSSLLSGRVCVISGVGPGLGRRSALGLGAHGADLVISARNVDRLKEIAAEVEELGARVITVPCDVTSMADCEAVAHAAKEEFGRIDVLVNNAFRYDVFQTFEQVELEAWKKIMDVNLWGALQLTKALLPELKDSGHGSIVNIASMVVRKPQLFEPGYAISKGALVTATRVLANELGASGIRANAVVPGWMWGPSVETFVDITVAGGTQSRQEVIAGIESRIPLSKIPSDAEVAGAVIFLASDLSAAITGQTIDANGGEVFA